MKMSIYKTDSQLEYIFNALLNLGYVFDKIQLIQELQQHYLKSKSWEYHNYSNMMEYYTKDVDGHFLTNEDVLKRLIDNDILQIDEF